MDELEKKNALEKYKITSDFLKFEAATLWQIFNAFFIGNNIFIVIIAGLLQKEINNYILFLTVGIIGLLISFLWFGTFRRNSHWYSYRMKQAKRDEENFVKSIKDEEWFLFNREAESFADGSHIKGLKNNISGYGMIMIFMLIYITLIFWALYNILCKC